MEHDSIPIINTLEFYEQVMFAYADKNNDSDDCRELDGHICYTLLEEVFARTKSCCWFVKKHLCRIFCGLFTE